MKRVFLSLFGGYFLSSLFLPSLWLDLFKLLFIILILGFILEILFFSKKANSPFWLIVLYFILGLGLGFISSNSSLVFPLRGEVNLVYSNFSYSLFNLKMFSGRNVFFLLPFNNGKYRIKLKTEDEVILKGGKVFLREKFFFIKNPEVKVIKKLFSYYHFIKDRSFRVAPYFRSYFQSIMGIEGEGNKELELKLHCLGLDHLKAISGLHLGVIAGFLYLLHIPDFIIIMVLFFYLYLINFKMSALRAFFLIVFLLVVKKLNRPFYFYHYLFLTTILSMVMFPGTFRSWGTFLSYYAVFSIFRFFTLKPTFLLSKFPGWVGLNFYLFWSLLPFTSFLGGRVLLIQPVANLVFLPLFSFLYVISFLSLFFSFMFPLVNWCFWGFSYLVDKFLFLSISIPLGSVAQKILLFLGIIKVVMEITEVDERSL